jgi:Fic family protein
LIRMAVAHYQFEAIHPFTDGNGRTGRILNQLMLIETGLLELPVLYLSRYIIANKTDYYTRLDAVTRKAAWEQWTLYMLEGVRETAAWTTEKINAVRALMAHTAEYMRARLPKVYSRELVELTFVQPYCRIRNLVESGMAKRETASKHLKDLARIGVLREVRAGREKLFIHPKFIQLLTGDTHRFAPYEIPRRPAAAKARPAAARA